MNIKIIYNIMIVLQIVCFCLLVFAIQQYWTYNGNRDFFKETALECADQEVSYMLENAEINGFYSHDKEYYVVVTKDRGFDMINKTDYHEACHALIHKDKEHFCRSYDGSN